MTLSISSPKAVYSSRIFTLNLIIIGSFVFKDELKQENRTFKPGKSAMKFYSSSLMLFVTGDIKFELMSYRLTEIHNFKTISTCLFSLNTT